MIEPVRGIPSARAVGAGVSTLLAAPLSVAAALAGAIASRTRDRCDIPPPCWEPQPAGCCHLGLIPGGTGLVRLHVANCGWSTQVIQLTAMGKLAAWLAFLPTTVVLGPQELATMDVAVHVPDKTPLGQHLRAPILVRGCRDHYVRLDVTVTDCAGPRVCEATIDDCADQIHHWYDHFYCPRPCRSPRPDQTGKRDG